MLKKVSRCDGGGGTRLRPQPESRPKPPGPDPQQADRSAHRRTSETGRHNRHRRHALLPRRRDARAISATAPSSASTSSTPSRTRAAGYRRLGQEGRRVSERRHVHHRLRRRPRHRHPGALAYHRKNRSEATWSCSTWRTPWNSAWSSPTISGRHPPVPGKALLGRGLLRHRGHPGMYILEPQVLDLMEPARNYDWSQDIFPDARRVEAAVRCVVEVLDRRGVAPAVPAGAVRGAEQQDHAPHRRRPARQRHLGGRGPMSTPARRSSAPPSSGRTAASRPGSPSGRIPSSGTTPSSRKGEAEQGDPVGFGVCGARAPP